MSENCNIAQMSDREIVDAILAHNRDVTEAYFYRKCYPLFKACFDMYYTDCETCIEFINEIYLYLMLPNTATHRSYMQNFSFRCTLTNWLKIVAKTYCHQLFKKKDFFNEDSLDDGDRFICIADSLSENSSFDRSDLELVLQMMPNVRYRELIRIKYLEGCSNEETADRLGMTMDNFYNKHLLAKKQFITALKKEGLI
ncbi:MAG: sigma-70 family RNA polymerase sigma factor [Alphaproteobacteria bacterium]|nr:sigma-70 family RNA polymerase sigma factor [Alphaproteobacteria bacterium]